MPTTSASPIVAAPVVPLAPLAQVRWPIPPFLGASVVLHGAAAALATAIPGSWPWALGAVLADHAALTGAGLWPRSAWLGPNVRRLPGTAPQVAITIDDGPDPEVTPAVLDLLAAAGAKATFFCIGERARAQPALLRRVVAGGHSVQNHSLRHHHGFSLLGPRRLAREIGDAQAVLADITGVRPHAFRAPAGLRNMMLDPVLHRQRLHLVSWTRRGFDTREADPARVQGRLCRGLAGGDILLLHDGHARHSELGQAVILDVLPSLLQRCQAAGLRTVTLAEALPPRSIAP